MIDELSRTCQNELNFKNLDTKVYQKRLKWELKEIEVQNEAEYFLDLYNKKTKCPKNENNLLVLYLLGIVDDFDINSDPVCEYGDSPDIDIDFIEPVRDYLKNEWAYKTFGENNVCNIGTYGTYGIKSALLDMARIYGESRDEALNITKQIQAKDDEGKNTTWEKALELYPDFKNYCESHSEVAEAARRLVHRNKSIGQHAAGLIISSKRLDNFIPLVKRKGTSKFSAWTEGLHDQDLQPMGLIKFDLLVIDNLLQIAKACHLIKKRHGLKSICALEGESDWSDCKAYRNDEKGLELARNGSLKGIFQFDSDGIRSLVKKVKVDRFEDLVAITSLFRPGPMSSLLHLKYAKRKNGEEKYEVHPLMEHILGVTYGCMIYQEQISKILNEIGDIPLSDCKDLIKAISKKKVDHFQKFKDKFVNNATIKLGWKQEEVEKFWRQIELFSEYSFNLAHATCYTYLSSRLLWLKAHHLKEFYTAILSCETLPEKIKDYKTDAHLNKIEVERPDINISKETFDIINDKIYYGLSHIKGIGVEVAQKIVNGQPYSSFIDFLQRFGTDASVLKPLIGLRLFKDSDPATLFKYADYYKKNSKKIEDKQKRFQKSMEKYGLKLKELIPEEHKDYVEFNEENFKKWEELFDKNEVKNGKKYNLWKKLLSLWKARNRSVEKSKAKLCSLTLDQFSAKEYKVVDKIVKDLEDPIQSERLFFGFSWEHRLEKSPDFSGLTFHEFENDNPIARVEIEILKVNLKTSSNKKTKYYQLEVEDVNGEKKKANIWMDDWERWKDELKVGNLLRMKLKAPAQENWPFSLDCPLKHERYKLPKYKKDDFRVVVLEDKKDQMLSNDEILQKYS